eukprot:gene5520-11126_t
MESFFSSKFPDVFSIEDVYNGLKRRKGFSSDPIQDDIDFRPKAISGSTSSAFIDEISSILESELKSPLLAQPLSEPKDMDLIDDSSSIPPYSSEFMASPTENFSLLNLLFRSDYVEDVETVTTGMSTRNNASSSSSIDDLLASCPDNHLKMFISELFCDLDGLVDSASHTKLQLQLQSSSSSSSDMMYGDQAGAKYYGSSGKLLTAMDRMDGDGDCDGVRTDIGSRGTDAAGEKKRKYKKSMSMTGGIKNASLGMDLGLPDVEERDGDEDADESVIDNKELKKKITETETAEGGEPRSRPRFGSKKLKRPLGSDGSSSNSRKEQSGLPPLPHYLLPIPGTTGTIPGLVQGTVSNSISSTSCETTTTLSSMSSSASMYESASASVTVVSDGTRDREDDYGNRDGDVVKNKNKKAGGTINPPSSATSLLVRVVGTDRDLDLALQEACAGLLLEEMGLLGLGLSRRPSGCIKLEPPSTSTDFGVIFPGMVKDESETVMAIGIGMGIGSGNETGIVSSKGVVPMSGDGNILVTGLPKQQQEQEESCITEIATEVNSKHVSQSVVRTAHAQLAAECIHVWKARVAAFDAVWTELTSRANGSFRSRWESQSRLRTQVHCISPLSRSLETVPLGAELMVNPFVRGNGCSGSNPPPWDWDWDWDWLSHADQHQQYPMVSPSRGSSCPTISDIHIGVGQVVTSTTSMPTSTSTYNCDDAPATPVLGLKRITNTDICVERMLRLLRLGHHVIAVDKTKTNTRDIDGGSDLRHHMSSRTDNAHRANMIRALLCRLLDKSEDVDKVHRGNDNGGVGGSGNGNGGVGGWGCSERPSPQRLSSSSRRRGPVLVVCKVSQLETWESSFTTTSKVTKCDNENNDSNDNDYDYDYNLRVTPYYGCPEDRAGIRSYWTDSDGDGDNALYGSRARSQVVLTHYDCLLSDIAYFRQMSWLCVVMDEPWGVLSNERHSDSALNLQGLCVACRHLVFSCSSIRHPLHHHLLPDTLDVAKAVVPYFWRLFSEDNPGLATKSKDLWGNGNEQSSTTTMKAIRELVNKFLIASTVVCENDIIVNVNEVGDDGGWDVISTDDQQESLSSWEWTGTKTGTGTIGAEIGHLSPSTTLQLTVTSVYSDPDIDIELGHRMKGAVVCNYTNTNTTNNTTTASIITQSDGLIRRRSSKKHPTSTTATAEVVRMDAVTGEFPTTTTTTTAEGRDMVTTTATTTTSTRPNTSTDISDTNVQSTVPLPVQSSSLSSSSLSSSDDLDPGAQRMTLDMLCVSDENLVESRLAAHLNQRISATTKEHSSSSPTSPSRSSTEENDEDDNDNDDEDDDYIIPEYDDCTLNYIPDIDNNVHINNIENTTYNTQNEDELELEVEEIEMGVLEESNSIEDSDENVISPMVSHDDKEEDFDDIFY